MKKLIFDNAGGLTIQEILITAKEILNSVLFRKIEIRSFIEKDQYDEYDENWEGMEED